MAIVKYRRARKVRKMRRRAKGSTKVNMLAKMVRRMRPEVKMKHTHFWNNARLLNDPSFSTTLNKSDYEYLFVYPNQGVTENDRIGDHIRVKKIWLNLTFIMNTILDTYNYRVIIWSPTDTKFVPGTNDVPSFWKWSNCQHPVMQNMVNRTKYKVHFDKCYTANAPFESGGVANVQQSKIRNYNIVPRRQNVTFNTSNDPKYATNMYYITVVCGHIGGTNGSYNMVWVGQCSMYYTDN
jgi:hypothetical protein